MQPRARLLEWTLWSWGWSGPQLGGGQGDTSGYGIMPQAQPQAQTGAQPSGDDVADAMSALPDDLRRHLGL